MKFVKAILLFVMIAPAFAAEVAVPSLNAQLIEKVKKTDPVCTNCNFIVQKKKYDLIANHDVYEVTTFDILPPPAWHIAVRGKELLFMDRRKIDDWNNVISHEKIKLDQDSKVVTYAEFFLSTTMNQSEYISKLTKGEIEKIEAKEKKKIDAETKIVRSDKKIQIVFYANDTQGDLQQWNLVLSENGEIIKLQERSF